MRGAEPFSYILLFLCFGSPSFFLLSLQLVLIRIHVQETEGGHLQLNAASVGGLNNNGLAAAYKATKKYEFIW